MDSFSFEVKGLNRLIKRFDNAPEVLKKEMAAELYFSAKEIEGNAAAAAPTDDSFLRKGIDSEKEGELSWIVKSNAEYSAYVEFGTGDYVEITQGSNLKGLANYAMSFYVNGKGKLPARPFLFPAFQAESLQLIKKIKNILKDL